jgi:hypothetical protein
MLPHIPTAAGFILVRAGADGLFHDTAVSNSPLPTVLMEVTIAELSSAKTNQ